MWVIVVLQVAFNNNIADKNSIKFCLYPLYGICARYFSIRTAKTKNLFLNKYQEKIIKSAIFSKLVIGTWVKLVTLVTLVTLVGGIPDGLKNEREARYFSSNGVQPTNGLCSNMKGLLEHPPGRGSTSRRWDPNPVFYKKIFAFFATKFTRLHYFLFIKSYCGFR